MNKEEIFFVVGLGLIGGSFALDIKEERKGALVYGYDISDKHLEEAFELGIIDRKASLEEVIKADWVIVAVPVNYSAELLNKILDVIQDETIVFDVGSTKGNVCNLVRNHSRRRNFMATHPIAGTEFSGPKAAIKGLFRGKTNIICEVEKTAFVFQEKVFELFKDLGMRIRYMDPYSHDKHIAYMSHLSHISSFMLGKTVIEEEKNERDIFDMAGSGFESTVRLAKSCPSMWTPIFRENKEPVLKALVEYIDNLLEFKKNLEEENDELIHQTMVETNRIKQILRNN